MLFENKVYIIIPVFNRINDTLECIQSILKMDYINKNIIIIDDGSNDNTEEQLKKLYPEIQIIKSNGNLWWAKSVNIGITYAIDKKADYLMLLNNDCIVEKKLLTNLILYSENNPSSILAPCIYNYQKPEEIIFSGKKEYWITQPFKKTSEKYNLDPRFIKTDIIYGKGTLIKVELLRKIGLFNANLFPHYHSDIDFSLRAKRKKIPLLIATDCKVWTKVESKIHFYCFNTFFSRKSSINLHDTYKLYKKYCPYHPFIVFYILFYISKIVKFILMSLRYVEK